jgi:hypothetical protein
MFPVLPPQRQEVIRNLTHLFAGRTRTSRARNQRQVKRNVLPEQLSTDFPTQPFSECAGHGIPKLSLGRAAIAFDLKLVGKSLKPTKFSN